MVCGRTLIGGSRWERRHIGHVRLVGICLASLLILLASALTGCGESAVDTGTAPKTTTSTAAATTASSGDETTSSLAVPVSASNERPDWLGTTSTGTGPVDLHCSVAFAASQPQGAVHVSLYNEAGEFIDFRDGMPYDFKGLEPGTYRLGVFGVDTGYISQWYGGLPVQGHDISESQVAQFAARAQRRRVRAAARPQHPRGGVLDPRDPAEWRYPGVRFAASRHASERHAGGPHHGQRTEPLLAG